MLKFNKFRELFFPHMTLAGEDPVLNKEYTTIKTEKQKEQYKIDARDRIMKLNSQICDKIANNFTSVNKAFLTIDQDHDGYIEPKDIVSLYGTHITIDYADLVKVLETHNSRADG